MKDSTDSSLNNEQPINTATADSDQMSELISETELPDGEVEIEDGGALCF